MSKIPVKHYDIGNTKNYILEGDGSATTGWSLYNDSGEGSTTQPVNGTGGISTLTFARDTSSPLRNEAQFLLTKPSGSNQGQGVSYDFTIDRADQAKRLTISFDYLVASGTYADGDIGVYIVDVTNGTVIQPAGFQVQNISGVAGKELATFQTASNSTSYRLCLHVASTSASAYTLRIDNVQVGPVNATFSTPVTDWVSYTPTLTNGNNTTPTAQWRRVGSSIEIKGGIQWNAAGAGSTLLFSLPPGLTFASSAGDVAGSGFAFTGAGFQTVSVRATVGSNTLFFARTGDASNFSGSQALSSAWSIAFEGTWPVTGWSSSAQVVSDSSEGRVVSMSSRRLGGVQALSGGSDVKLQYNSVQFDTHGGFDTVNNRYVVRVPGIYHFSGTVVVSSSTNTVLPITLYKNGSAIKEIGRVLTSTSAVTTGATFSAEEPAVAGDFFEVFINPATVSSNFLGTSNIFGGSQFNVAMRQGSQTLLGGETVAAEAFRVSTGQAVGPSMTKILFDGVEFDYTGSFSTANSRFTAPSPGLYEISADVSFPATASLTVVELGLYVNGSRTRTSVALGSASVPTGVSTSYQFRLLAGQFVEIWAGSNVATTVLSGGTIFGGSRMSVRRVGNY